VTPPIEGEGAVDDPFYQALGEAMAEWIAKNPLFIRRKERVGVGSGRAVYNTIKALQKYAPLNTLEPELLSLSGAAWARPALKPRSVDADFNVHLFNECFQNAQPVYVSYPLTAGLNRKLTWLDRDRWSKETCPTVAFVGVGSIQNKEHRFWAASPNDTKDVLLATATPKLSELVSLFSDLHVDDYSPVGDVANNLIFVEHPDKAVADRVKKHKKEIVDKIKELNDTFLNVSDSQFRDISSVALIAGEKSKAFAIRELFLNPNYNVTCLCTDVDTAKELVALEEKFPSQGKRPMPDSSALPSH
jgi:DNA-binding transcriptional regulator LsrR (DeoR family)